MQIVDQFVHIAGILGRNGITDAGFLVQCVYQRNFLFFETFVECRSELGKVGFAAGRGNPVQKTEHFPDFRNYIL